MDTPKDQKPPAKVAYAITERNGRSFWARIGRGFVNKDGSITVKLEAVPVSGTLQLRDWEPKDEVAGATPYGDSPGRTAYGRHGDANGAHVPTELPF